MTDRLHNVDKGTQVGNDGTAGKERLDVLLAELGYFVNREKAKAAIMAGIVYLADERMEKPGIKVSRTADITVKGTIHPYVGRGGLKLEKALQHFSIDVSGVSMLDIGASTGGFTDCALRHGASHVFAIDVGYNQLDWSLRNDPRVTVMERTNFRYMQPTDLERVVAKSIELAKSDETPNTVVQPNFATIDVSFISLKHMLTPLKELLAPTGRVIALIKPQFEAGRNKVGNSGVVRDRAIHFEVLTSVIDFAAGLGYDLKGLTFSPITGGEGNIEFLAYWHLVQNRVLFADQWKPIIHDVVQEASEKLTR